MRKLIPLRDIKTKKITRKTVAGDQLLLTSINAYGDGSAILAGAVDNHCFAASLCNSQVVVC